MEKTKEEVHLQLKTMLNEMQFWYQQPKMMIDVGQLQRWMLVAKKIDEYWSAALEPTRK